MGKTKQVKQDIVTKPMPMTIYKPIPKFKGCKNC